MFSGQKRKVCCFCERWESGGIESFLYNVLLHMDLSVIQVDIVAAELAESIFTESLREHGVRFVELSGAQRKFGENHRLFKKLLQKEQYDVVHLNIFHGLSLYYARLTEQAGVPVRIAHSHNTALRKSVGRPLKLMLHNAAKKLFTGSATDLWACSETAAKFLFSKRCLEHKGFQFIPNGIDMERFRFDPAARMQIRKELGLENELLVGSVGRLCYQKNQDFLLDVFAELYRREPESRLLLVGEGEAETGLRQKAERLGIAEAVIFYGTSSRAERLLWAMDVFAFPSRFEGLGIAAIEAQAAGLPVVASEGVPEETRITPPFQRVELGAGPAQWAEALLDIHTETRAACAEKVRCAGFDIADTVRKIEGCYMRVGTHG